MPLEFEPPAAVPRQMRPDVVEGTTLAQLLSVIEEAGGGPVRGPSGPPGPPQVRSELPGPSGLDGADRGAPVVTGIAMDSRTVRPGDLYVGLPGARGHGASFAAAAVRSGAVLVLTDQTGSALLDGVAVPVLVAKRLRTVLGPLAACIYQSQPDTGAPTLYGVTGTNGKTTTTYFLNSALKALGKTTGLIGTIEILAGSEAIASELTTPESPQVHGLLALMRERGLDAAAMEVSSHAISYARVDGVRFDVVGFSNLTQDHLDLHGSMDAYYGAKAQLFTAARARRAVVTVDDQWGRRLATESSIETTTLAAADIPPADDVDACPPDWQVSGVETAGLGHRYLLRGPDAVELRVHTGLPGAFNVANSALASVMLLASGVPAADLQTAIDERDPFSVAVPGRMQVLGTAPAAIVDFAHNPDALQRALRSVRSGSGARVIVVFGATGQRDQTKRADMGAIAARYADIVIITDDDPHDEDPAQIRAALLTGAQQARAAEDLDCEIYEVHPRPAAIDDAVRRATRADVILVAGRGHEVVQEVAGVNLPLDDRVELASGLRKYGFTAPPTDRIES